MSLSDDRLAARAEFYLMLSRALLPPTAPDAPAAFVDALPGDLHDAAQAAGYDNAGGDSGLARCIDDYAAAAAALAGPTALLRAYASLFLAPPREAQLYVSVYLDGAVLGRSADALEAFYRKHGLARSEDFHDLPDHLSAVLEFLALLYAKAAETDGYTRADLLNDATQLNRTFLLSWVPVMKRQLARLAAADAAPPVYLRLAEILEAALIADAGELSPALRRVLSPDGPAEPAEASGHEMAYCIDCGAEIAPAARVRRVRKVLEKEGMDTRHLDRCPKCRGATTVPVFGAG